jgi:hypothetical protein
MSFESYKDIGEVLKEYEIASQEDRFILETNYKVRSEFQEDLEFCLSEFTFDKSEYAVCEAIVFPVLKEIYRSYYPKFSLWSHQALTYDQRLCGIPDYILAKRSPLGKEVFEYPFFAAVEAKRDDFIKGWGQCLAEMVAIQKLNNSLSQTIFGIVSNGQFWQFGKLKASLFTKNKKSYTISDLGSLLSALDYIFAQCELELTAFPDRRASPTP